MYCVNLCKNNLLKKKMKLIIIISLYCFVCVLGSHKNYHIPAVRFANNTNKIVCPYTVRVSRDPTRVPRKIVHIECMRTGRVYKNSTMECRQLYYHIKVKYIDSSESRDQKVNASCVGYTPHGKRAHHLHPHITR